MGYSVSIWGKVSLMILGPRTPLHPKECQTLRPLRSQAPSWEASKEGVTVCSDRSSGSPGPPPDTWSARTRPPTLPGQLRCGCLFTLVSFGTKGFCVAGT